ncbi:MAG: hypothetical protein E2O82_05095 [Betaproteobacteria bacterium]|nr:MAG: hypothetical protein E2O82_05095 [Betaproteobacteria bacterium]
MTVTHSAQARNNIADAILALIDAGGAGKLIFRTSGDAEVATLTFSVTSGVVAAEVLTFNAITDDSNATGGTVAKATIEDDSSNAVILTDAVQTSGGDINLSSLVVAATDTVSCSALTYTAPP